MLSNHDVIRHATRYGLAPDGHLSRQTARDWLLSYGTAPELDRDLGLRRARAATLLILALPGSAYLYQGEELGLHEVGELPDGVLQDPTFHRSGGQDKGRDGCRVPLPWTARGLSFGFSIGAAHIPQPGWFGSLSVEAEEADPGSTLTFYRHVLGWRRRLLAADEMEWQPGASDQVVHFRRPGGWQSVTNFGPGPVPLPPGTVAIASAPVHGDQLPADTTAWILDPGRPG